MRIKEKTLYGFSIKEIRSVKIHKSRIGLDDLTPPPGSSFDNFDDRICLDFYSFDGTRVARIRDDELPEGLVPRDLESIIFEKGYLDLTDLEKYVKIEEKVEQELNCLDKLLNNMKSRDRDSSSPTPNAVDKGYHLAVIYLEEEINKLKEELIEESEVSKEI